MGPRKQQGKHKAVFEETKKHFFRSISGSAKEMITLEDGKGRNWMIS